MAEFIGAHIPQLFIAMCIGFGIVSLFVTIDDALHAVVARRAG